MGNSNKYWRDVAEVGNDLSVSPVVNSEFSEGLPMEEILSDGDGLSSNRRDFLKFFGFSVSAVALAACNKAPIKYAIPYLDKPENVTPGNALYYATSSGVYNEGFPVIAKVREGRPIKLDGNAESFLSQGALCALGQANILSLYDTNRMPNPRIEGSDEEGWEKVDGAVAKILTGAAGKSIKVVTRTVSSPILQKSIDAFLAANANASQVVYDPISYSGIRNANGASFGKKCVPNYRFDKAKVVVSFGADFLGTWISPVRFAADYSKNRIPTPDNPTMSKHYQIEGNMTMTGTNADARFPMANSKHGVLLANLYNLLRGKMGLGIDETIEVFELPGNNLATVANDLWDSRGASLVISGSNNANEQSIVNSINALLGNYDETIDITNASNISSYDEVAFDGFVSDLNSGRVGAVIFVNTNPVYSYSKGAKLAAALAKTKVISTTSVLDESAAKANINAPDNHGLESWDVFEPIEGYYTTAQPVISKVFNTRAAAESLLLWSGVKLAENTENQASYAWVNDFISSKGGNSEKVIHDGFLDLMSSPSAPAFTGNTASAIAGLTKSKNGLEVALYQKVGVKDGSNSFNPWAHEMPDPVTKVTYDNYVLISKSDAEANDLENGAFISVKAANGSVDLPVFIQPGQAKNTLGIALGYGRTVVTSAENDLVNLGKNAYPLMAANGETCIQGVTIEKLNETYEFAQTQTHHTIEGRDYMREATLGEYKENNNVRNEHPPHIVSLWDEVDYSKGHHWGMAIDMNACTGCGSCIVSCSIENNVPVVGRDEVRRRREMHWIRIDRYYAFEVSESQDITVPLFGGRSKEKGEYVTKETEIAGLDENNTTNHYAHYDNVSVVHQAVMCQHCDHAPCETVCPVLATTHSSEGLNQMTYNRCIGTKYCANNCPYKVRRFNWFRYNMNDKFDYHFNSELGRMVLNPDVTVRSRGVMEKCSFCVQNIQLAKLNAKRASTTMKDGDVSVACAKACPSNAIVFGDRNDPESKIAKLFKNDRAYKMLEEIDTAPSVVYLTKIRNKKEAVKAENSHS